MPGVIRVCVLEAVDLPEVFTDGTTLACVTAKVTLGRRLFKTQPGVADGGRIETWNANFAFPVMNLRDNLVVSICNSEDQSMTQTAIAVPSIIQKGSRDEFVSLNKGGRIHLRMSFALTDEERKKIEAMRLAAASQQREELKKTVVVFQPVQKSPTESHRSPIASVDNDVAIASKTPLSQPIGFDSSPEAIPQPPPKPVFNYAKAIGVQSGSERMESRKPMVVVSEHSADEVVGNGHTGVDRIRESDSSAGAPSSGCCVDGTCPHSNNDGKAQSNSTPTERGSESVLNEVKPSNVESDAELGFVPENELEASTCADEPVSAETKPTPALENFNKRLKVRNSEFSVENVEASVLGDSRVKTVPTTELETQRTPESTSSGRFSWKAVKATVKKALPQSCFTSSSHRVSCRTGVVQVQDLVRKGFSNIKGSCARSH